MKTHKILFVIFLIATLNLVDPVGASDSFFPLMAWNHAPGDEAVLKKMRECGLTVAGFVSTKDLDLCNANGLKAIVSDPRVSNYDWKNVNPTVARQNVTSLVAEIGNKPAVYGFYLRDEPGADLFPGLGILSKIIQELAPGKWPYINLFPNYANAQQLGTATYNEHLDRFIEICKPTTLSYDHYALMDDGSLRKGYFENLEQMKSAARKNHLPFWNIVLTVAHFTYREPTAADLRFQVFTTLAYGGRGIAYFTYFAPEVGNYRLAPIDQFGNPTPTWYFMQNVNLQVQKLAPVLLQLTSDDVYHFGALPALCHGPTETSLIKAVNHSDFLVGDFTHNDKSRYVMIVNKSFTKSHHCAVEFRNPPRRIQMVSPYNGRVTDFGGEQLWLAPGQGTLLKLD